MIPIHVVCKHPLSIIRLAKVNYTVQIRLRYMLATSWLEHLKMVFVKSIKIP